MNQESIMSVPVTVSTQQIVQSYRCGMTCREIANKYNITPVAVYKRLYRQGLRTTQKRCKFDERFFETIDTEQKSYWLGFIFADGCVIRRKYSYGDVTALRIGLSIKDQSHLESFLRDINSTNAVNICNNETECRVSLQSEYIVSDLEKYGCVERKSLKLRFPILKPQMIRHFIRGYFDGDGSVSTQGKNLRMSIVGTGSFLSSVRQHLLSRGVQFTRPRKRGNIFVLEGNGNRKAKKFYDYLYARSSVYLCRKKEKFDAFL